MSPQRLKPRLILHLRRGLKPRPFKAKSKPEFFRSLFKPRPVKNRLVDQVFSNL